jgi:hypothetical protein
VQQQVPEQRGSELPEWEGWVERGVSVVAFGHN